MSRIVLRRLKRKPAGKEPYDAPARRGLIIGLCVFFSVLLWFFSSLAQTYSRTLAFPTQLENLPADEALLALPPAELDVDVESEGMHLLRLFYNRPVVRLSADAPVLDLEEAARASLPENVRLTSVWPRFSALQKEKRETRKVPIQFVGAVTTPPTHALIEPPRLSPDSVVLSGPVSLVETIQDWPTRPLRQSSLKDSLVTRVELVDSLAGVVDLGVRAVTLRARAAPFTEATRALDIFISGIPSATNTIQLDPPSVVVRFRVPLAHYERALDAPDFLATVTYDEIRSDTSGTIAPRIELPQGIILTDIEVNPARVRYYDVLEER